MSVSYDFEMVTRKSPNILVCKLGKNENRHYNAKVVFSSTTFSNFCISLFYTLEIARCDREIRDC